MLSLCMSKQYNFFIFNVFNKSSNIKKVVAYFYSHTRTKRSEVKPSIFIGLWIYVNFYIYLKRLHKIIDTIYGSTRYYI